jgi:hypothetical protein
MEVRRKRRLVRSHTYRRPGQRRTSCGSWTLAWEIEDKRAEAIEEHDMNEARAHLEVLKSIPVLAFSTLCEEIRDIHSSSGIASRPRMAIAQ